MNVADRDRDYRRSRMRRRDLDECPVKQFERWFEQACNAEPLEPNAMVLATAPADRQPTQRTVLLKTFDQRGFVFFSNYQSRKSLQIDENPQVSALFFWPTLERQVEINGIAERVSTADSIAYFATRPRGSQIGAWCSRQSSVISSRKILVSNLAEWGRKFRDGEVPMPSFWGGFRIVPKRLEFWQGRPDRIHDRFEYLRNELDWTIQRLSP